MVMTNFLETTEWKELSKKVRNRDGCCCKCGSQYRLCADHIIPRSIKPSLQLAEFNIQTLCWNCNNRKGAFYIVCFLKNPSQELLQEISLLRIRFQEKARSYAKRNLTKRNYKDLEKKIMDDPNIIDNLEDIFYKMLNYPESAKNPVFKTVAFAARFMALPVILPSMLLFDASKAVRSRPSAQEVENFAARITSTRFNDWK